MTVTVNVQEAKAQLSRILRQVEAGEEVVIARGGRPVARLTAVTPPPQRPVGFVGAAVTDEFFLPLPPDELRQWS